MRSVGSHAKCRRDGDGPTERFGTAGVGDYDSCDAAGWRIWEAVEYRVWSGSGADFARGGSAGEGDLDARGRYQPRFLPADDASPHAGGAGYAEPGGCVAAPHCSPFHGRDVSGRRYSGYWRNGNRGHRAAEWLGDKLFSGTEFSAHGGSARVLACSGSELESFCSGEFYR